jgi:hypothetical protein
MLDILLSELLLMKGLLHHLFGRALTGDDIGCALADRAESSALSPLYAQMTWQPACLRSSAVHSAISAS